jgi:hypothetical protein
MNDLEASIHLFHSLSTTGMSIRHTLRSAAAALPATRSIASSSRVLAPAPAPPPADAAGGEGGFMALFNNLSSTQSGAPHPSTTSVATPYGAPSAHTPRRAELIRGYAPEALPPQIDPLLDLFTNMLMKHGRKTEAQGHVSDILSML